MAAEQSPALLDTKPKWLDNVGAFVLCSLTVCFVIITIGPYFNLLPGTLDLTVAANQNAVVNNLFIAAVSFFIGASVATRKKDDAIGTLASAAAAIQAALPTNPDNTKTVPLAAGDTVTVKAEGDKTP